MEEFDLEREYKELYGYCKKEQLFDLGRLVLDKLLVIQQLKNVGAWLVGKKE